MPRGDTDPKESWGNGYTSYENRFLSTEGQQLNPSYTQAAPGPPMLTKKKKKKKKKRPQHFAAPPTGSEKGTGPGGGLGVLV